MIIVTYNSYGVIDRCLTSLPLRDDVEVLVVDNASSDRTVVAVQESRGDVLIIQNGVNVGFAVAVNQAAAVARGEILLLLNPDAAISAENIDTMLELLVTRPDIGVAAPFVNEGGGAFHTLAVGYTPNLRRMFAHATGLSRLGKSLPFLTGHYLMRSDVKMGETVELDWVSGGCMFVRASLWHELGGLSERWFMYAEDIEFCLRARKHGSRVAMHSAAVAEHEVGASSGQAAMRPVNTAWLANLFDLYRTTIATNRLQVELWRLTVMFGYDLRAVTLRLMSPGRTGDVGRFRAYASALRRGQKG